MTGNGNHTTYKNGDLGTGKHDIVLPTLFTLQQDQLLLVR